MATYSKPHLTFDDQLALLKSRGLQVADDAVALRYLRSVGYYTLGGYLYAMREIRDEGGVPVRADVFLNDATFDHVRDLFEFDRQLRRLCLEALEVIERAIKVKVAYNVGRDDPMAHVTGSALDPAAFTPREGRRTRHEVWLDKHQRKVSDRAHDAIAAFITKYGPDLPIWVAIDAMDFGDISHLLALLSQSWQARVAQGFGLLSGPQMVSWTRTMCEVRNYSAHHERLWNRAIKDQPARPKGKERKHFSELDGEKQLTWARPYASFVVMAYFMRQIEKDDSWANRMGALLDTLPVGPGVNYAALGAPVDWRTNQVWNLSQ